MINGLLETTKYFLDSGFFKVVKFFIAIYIAVLFVDLILVLIARGVGANIRVAVKGADIPTASKKKMQKRWMDIESRLLSGDMSQYKIAILEADGFVNETLGKIGYKGRNMKEKLEGITDRQLSAAQPLREAHSIRNEIINDRNYSIDRERAAEALNIYKNFLETIEII
ncbi:MAG: hypothetical protein WCR65_01565 [Parcubacteria group bacterium]